MSLDGIIKMTPYATFWSFTEP